nr:reverse transcriptase domain-containing protein [Tanacetum cinerariifolium]
KEVVDDYLRKPFKEALKAPITRRIIEFAGPEYNMLANIKLYDETTNPEDHLDKALTTMTDMMMRLDDFIHSEKSFAQTELPKGETGEQHKKSYFPSFIKDDRPFRNNHPVTDQRRTGLRALRAIPSTIHAMMKFPSLRGIATLVTRSVIISECRQLEKRQVIKEEKKEEVDARAVNITEEVLVNPAFLDQLVAIGGRLPEIYETQLKLLLKRNIDVFAWEPANMTEVPQRIIEHNLNVNPSIEPEQQKRRVLAPKRTK